MKGSLFSLRLSLSLASIDAFLSPKKLSTGLLCFNYGAPARLLPAPFEADRAGRVHRFLCRNLVDALRRREVREVFLELKQNSPLAKSERQTKKKNERAERARRRKEEERLDDFRHFLLPLSLFLALSLSFFLFRGTRRKGRERERPSLAENLHSLSTPLFHLNFSQLSLAAASPAPPSPSASRSSRAS